MLVSPALDHILNLGVPPEKQKIFNHFELNSSFILSYLGLTCRKLGPWQNMLKRPLALHTHLTKLET